MTSPLDLADAVILVTGGADGIGRALCLLALGRGATVIAVDTNADALTTLAREAQTNRLVTHNADVVDAQSMQGIVDETLASIGKLTVVVANAGIERIGPVHQMPPSDFEKIIEVNVLGVYRTLKPCIEPIIDSGGHMVAISSLAALLPFPFGAAYAASKSAVDMLMRVLRLELLDSGATAGAAYFGFVMTEMGQHVTSHPGVAELSKRLPKRLLGMAPHLPIDDAAMQLLHGIEKRRARVYAPWTVRFPHLLRGVLVPMDDFLGRHVMKLPVVARSLFRSDNEHDGS
jgi:NAD(P)-dependent dehydrogenase (short-subunit alcohol dehydrogenase family)